MTGTSPFVFHTPAEHARIGPLDAAMSTALDPSLNDTIRAQMMTGIASRDDLSAAITARMLTHLPHEAWTLLVTLLNNPRLHRAPKTLAQVRARIAPNAVPTLLAHLDEPARYLDDMLLAAHRHSSMYPGLADLVTETFTAEQINATADTLVETYLAWLNNTAADADHTNHNAHQRLHDLPGMAFLTPRHTHRIAAQVHDALTAYADAISAPMNGETSKDAKASKNAVTVRQARYPSEERAALSHLLRRTDIDTPLGHLLLDSIEVIARTETAQNSLYPYPVHSQIPTLLTHAKLPHAVLVRLLTTPALSAVLAEHRSASVGLYFNSGVVVDALRAGADPDLLLTNGHLRLPADVLDHILDTLDKRTGPLPIALLRALIDNSTDTIGTPAWDRLYDLWMAHVFATQDASAQDRFADVVEARLLGWADHSRTSDLHRFAAWASASPDPHLRRHAVKHIWSADQLRIATHDPSPLVREQTLDHDYVPEDVLTALATDPLTHIRQAVAAHRDTTSAVLRLLEQDPDANVRLAVAEHDQADQATLVALGDDPDERVRAAVAEKFLAALS